jgi:hypothetical protein
MMPVRLSFKNGEGAKSIFSLNKQTTKQIRPERSLLETGLMDACKALSPGETNKQTD